MCRYCSRLKQIRNADKLMYREMLDAWKRAYERQEKLLRRALLVINTEDDTTLMRDILDEICPDTIKGGEKICVECV